MKFISFLLSLFCISNFLFAQADEKFLFDTFQLEEVVVYDAAKAELFSRDSIMLYNELTLTLENDQRFRKNNKQYYKHKKEQDSIDRANSLRLIRITQTYGFPSSQRF